MNKLSLLLLVATSASLHADYIDPQLHYVRSCNRGIFTDLYNHTKPVIKEVKDALTHLSPTVLYEWITEHPYEQKNAKVRFADYDELCKQEKQFIKQRKARVKSGFNQLLNTDIPWRSMPNIAVCCSGGGFRAMVLSLGFLKGLEQTGLLDCSMYMTGLSGSTWALAPWVASQKSLSDYTADLPEKIYHGLESIKHPKVAHNLVEQLLTKVIYGQCISMVDVTGPTLANTLLTEFGNKRLDVRMSSSHAYIKDGCLPLPIYTAVTANVEPYEWLEFTPFEVGSSYLKAYVPTWAYGRKFKHGRSTNYAPEQSLGYFMGIFGYAFGIDVEDAVRHTSDSIKEFSKGLPSMLKGAISDILYKLVNSPLDDVRLAPSSLPNFVYKTETRPLNSNKTLTLIDAGIHFNLPFVPLLREERNVDIILTCDASGSIEGCKNLRWAEEYMQAQGIKFPPIDYEAADKQVMTIFKDEHDPNCPIVVYFPRIKNDAYNPTFDPEECLDDYCATLNFHYTREQVEELMGLAHFAVVQHKNDILHVIEEVLDHKTA